MNLQDYKTDDGKVKEGVWLEYDGAKFLIASSGTPKYTRALQRAFKGVPQHKVRDNPELANKATISAIADTVLLDWQGVKSGETPVPVTRENKLALLAIVPIREWVALESQNLANFRAEALAEDAEELKSGASVVDAVGQPGGIPGGTV
jgi:hypothetical protein